jgi:hypothetical protein
VSDEGELDLDELRELHEGCFDDACEVIQLLDLLAQADDDLRAAMATIRERR